MTSKTKSIVPPGLPGCTNLIHNVQTGPGQPKLSEIRVTEGCEGHDCDFWQKALPGTRLRHENGVLCPNPGLQPGTFGTWLPRYTPCSVYGTDPRSRTGQSFARLRRNRPTVLGQRLPDTSGSPPC
eukprot:2347498-Prymnesium_polylepis.1